MPSIELDRRVIHSPKGSLMMITEWKQKIMEVLCMDDELAKLLGYNSTDALSRKSLTENQKLDLVNKNIYGIRYVPDVVQEQKSFISLGLSGFVPQESFRQFSQRYVMGYIYFYILVDTQIMQIDEGYRQDLILSRVYDLFQDRDYFGIGKVQEGNMTELWEQNNKLGGYTLMFKVTDFK